jgi:hydrogenase/urease accessory protein HupE
MTRKLSKSLFLFLLAVPDLAFAHSPIKGINNFYNGALHPVLEPSHLLLLIALGLFFGQQRLKEIEWALKLSIAAVVLGLVAAWFSLAGAQVGTIILVSAAIIGLLIAASPPIPLYCYAIIGVVAGFSLGLDSAQETLSGKEKFFGLFGSAVGIYFFSMYPIAFSEYCSRKTWQKIGVRVIGSWVAASALLVLALSMSPARP